MWADNRAEVREFLRTRRGSIRSDQAGVPAVGHRQVPGLRREEVTLLAGISIDYYARMERGDLAGVSDEVLDALARALRLDEAETSHWHDLAEVAQPRAAARRRPGKDESVRPSLQRFLDSITGAPHNVRFHRTGLSGSTPRRR